MTAVIARLIERTGHFYSQANSVASEALSNVRTVTSFGLQHSFLRNYDAAIDFARSMGYKKGFLMGCSLGSMAFTMMASYGIALWFGSTLVRDGELTAGRALTVFLSSTMGAMTLSQLAPEFRYISEASGAAYEVFRTIDRKSLIDPRDEAGEKIDIQGDVEFRALNFRYPTRPEAHILKNFDLRVRRGQTVALVGQSGCGKSTIVGLIERFYDIEDGFGLVLIDGHPIKSLNLKNLRSQIGIVTQEPVLFAKTIFENISYGCGHVATKEDVIEVAKQANAHNFIDRKSVG